MFNKRIIIGGVLVALSGFCIYVLSWRCIYQLNFAIIASSNDYGVSLLNGPPSYILYIFLPLLVLIFGWIVLSKGVREYMAK